MKEIVLPYGLASHPILIGTAVYMRAQLPSSENPHLERWAAPVVGNSADTVPLS